jgi:hypothetical protein
MMMFGFGWLIILLVVILPILAGVLLIGKADLNRPYRSQVLSAPVEPAVASSAENKTQPAHSPPQYCSHCGAGLQSDWTHCPNCGAPVQRS